MRSNCSRAGCFVFSFSIGVILAAFGPISDGNVKAQELAPSTIVEIENHGERFFDATDEAADAFRAIGEVGPAWDEARDARQYVALNPADPEAMADYQRAKARLLNVKFGQFLAALDYEESVRQSRDRFTQQLEIEIAHEKNVRERERLYMEQVDSDIAEYSDELQRLKESLPRGAIDLDDPADLKLLNDLEDEIKLLQHQRMLARERELLADANLTDLENTKIQAEARYDELVEAFEDARDHLGILQSIARNEVEVIRHHERRELLTRLTNRDPIDRRGNREVLDALLVSNRERLSRREELTVEIDQPSLQESRKRVDDFLATIGHEDLPDESESTSSLPTSTTGEGGRNQ